MTKEKFSKEYCTMCGTQRCGGVEDIEFAEGCEHYQKHILGKKTFLEEMEEVKQRLATQQLYIPDGAAYPGRISVTPPPNSLYLSCEKVIIHNNVIDVDIEIDPKKVDQFESIIINGITFEKQNDAYWIDETEYYADDYSECNIRHVNACSRCGKTFIDRPPRCTCGARMRIKES